MNNVDLKTEIKQEAYSIKERNDKRIIIYFSGLPIYSFKDLASLVDYLDNLN